MSDRPGAIVDILSGEFWKNLPSIMMAAAGNPLGVIALLLILVSLLALIFLRRESWPVKGGLLVLLLIAGIGAVYVGSHAADGGARGPTAVAAAGRVIGEDGTPVIGAVVSIITEGIPPETRTDNAGNYSFSGIAIRSGSDPKLVVRASGYEYYERLLRPDQTGRFQDIRLTRSRTSTDSTPPAKGPSPPRRPAVIELRGRILDQAGAPVERAEVIIETEGTPPRTDTQYTDSHGYYRLTNYELRPNAAVKLRVRAEGFRPVLRNISPDARGRIEEVQLIPVR